MAIGNDLKTRGVDRNNKIPMKTAPELVEWLQNNKMTIENDTKLGERIQNDKMATENYSKHSWSGPKIAKLLYNNSRSGVVGSSTRFSYPPC